MVKLEYSKLINTWLGFAIIYLNFDFEPLVSKYRSKVIDYEGLLQWLDEYCWEPTSVELL